MDAAPMVAQEVKACAPLQKVKLLCFGGMDLDFKYCLDEAFAELIRRRAKEFAVDLSSVPPVSLVQACYVEHYMKRPIDYAAVLSGKEEKNDNVVEYKPPEVVVASGKSRKRKLAVCKSVATRRVRDLPRLAPVTTVKGMFTKGPIKNRFDLKFCKDRAFAAVIESRGQVNLGEKYSSAYVPSFFVQACYIEHFLRRQVEYDSVISTVGQEYKRIKKMKEESIPAPKSKDDSKEDLWVPSRQDLSTAAPFCNLLPLFPGGYEQRGKTYVFDLTCCTNKDFAALIESCHRKYMAACSVGELPAYLLQACYLEHFGGRKVDIETTIHNASCKRRSWNR